LVLEVEVLLVWLLYVSASSVKRINTVNTMARVTRLFLLRKCDFEFKYMVR